MRTAGPLDDAFVPTQRRILGNYTREQLVDILDKYDEAFDINASKEKLIDLIIAIMKNTKPVSQPETKRSDIYLYLSWISKYIVLLFIAYFAFLAVSLLIFYLFVPKPQKFCNTNKQSIYCITCPKFAKCKSNNVTCETGFTFDGRYCVKTDDDTHVISKMLDFATTELRKRAGKHRCGKCLSNYLTIDQLDALIYSQNFINPQKYDFVFQKMIQILQQQYNISTQYDDRTTLIASTIADRPFSCILRRFLISSTFLFILICILCYLIKYSIKRTKNQKFIENKAQYMAIKVINEMKNHDSEIDENTLKHKFSKNPEIDLSLWLIIDSYLKKSPYVIARKSKGVTYYRFIL
ncbi:hypothetical protein TVAG_052110 [Trichomonas vaginalis G3]|uniref:Man1/Src1-like C-terminal domain-containing protein n=1 Tax=Trichomonas vaginalis (strain ATCC PRA-98 / G3) TaxID=412133 RepID=A2F4K7_TRIV3|nr:inner nuclear membrane protein heh2-related family [Trichomonas vaginalis G3]EAY00163.1 hypothetical protein TVAG_052110 [Trichomonas vaginalis G3]KAI5541128.1 inner nuclear membrane protein heh2-related family [Trichomonas vaginalis G3]|eukprot:XP_001313092.1 hypothetical protein [Trichomonas vaginalis G3]